jgi:hypothetical protein
MATWTAKVFVNSQVGTINTEVEAATFSGAKQQIYAKHGNVQQITNLRQVSNRSSSEGSGVGDVGGAAGLLGLAFLAWLFYAFTPWILMGIGGAAGAWIGEKVTGQSVEDYNERDDDLGHGKAATLLALSLILGGVGFVQGDSLKKGFDAPSDTPAQVRPKN